MLLEQQIGEQLRQKNLTIAIAESCTGGLLGGKITDVTGASAYFLGGVIAYHNQVKEALLGVPRSVIQEHGAVSPQTAKAMAIGCHNLFKCDIAVSITGIAGPGGGSVEKPVGLSYVGLAKEDKVISRKFQLHGSRKQNRESLVKAAMELILAAMTSNS